MEKQLNNLRKKIDKVDDSIVGLLKKRLDLVNKVGELKRKHSIKPLDSKRWKMVLDKMVKKAEENDISKTLIIKIWNLIHKEALKIEKKI